MTNTQSGLAPSVPRRRFQPPVDGLDRQADGAHHQRKAHDARRPAPRRSSGRRRRCRKSRPGRRRSARAGRTDSSRIAGHDRRQDQRQVHQRVEQRSCPRSGRAPAASATAMPNGRLASIAQTATRRLSRTAVHLLGREARASAASLRTVKPCFSKTARACGAAQVVEERRWRRRLLGRPRSARRDR